MNLRETQQTSKLNKNSLKINFNGIALVFYEKVPRHFWRIAITRVLPSRDSEIRGAIVRLAKTNTIHKRPIKKLLCTFCQLRKFNCVTFNTKRLKLFLK